MKLLSFYLKYKKMFQGAICLTFLCHIVYDIHGLHACVPNTYFLMNGRLCYCGSQGTWTEADCKDVTQNQSCQPGQIIWQGCKQCVCQANTQLLCTNVFCNSNARKASIQSAFLEFGSKCLPFQTYYVNCSLCVCPASGQALDAQCVPDPSCPNPNKIDIVKLFKRNQCISNVIYLFPCIQCLCSDNGVFVPDKCVQKCPPQNQSVSRCKPRTLYRNDQEVCKCPDSGIRDDKLCVKSDFNNGTRITNLNILRSPSIQCTPGTFTKSKCLFCDCNSQGTIEESTCLELNCTVASSLMYKQTGACTPGELVPICLECFCLSHGFTNQKYCTRTCTCENKIKILEKVFSETLSDPTITDTAKFKVTRYSNDLCKSNTVYFKDGKYCLCSHDGNVELYCTATINHPTIQAKYLDKRNTIDSNKSCEPNTLVDIDCNTCYCSKKGKIDPKWCTYDDCEAKRLVQESHESHDLHDREESTGVCTPGSISKVKCNLCICPESGLLKNRACTKNSCNDYIDVTDSKFTCEPLAYYEVDCNICYCPRDGLKNVEKCTKNLCEKSFLRSATCVQGHLFSDECNVCLCPPNGNKADKVCTNHTCGAQSWNLFKLSESFLDNQVRNISKRSLDLCFPGEEFVMGCNLCVCSELGLKAYANCEPILCGDHRESQDGKLSLDNDNEEKKSTYYLHKLKHPRARRDVHEQCFLYNISNSAERKECTPGTMYIIRCRQCICPYIGNINNFCRPLPKDFYCEQAFPEYNYLPMGRRHVNNSALETKTKNTTSMPVTVQVKHSSHTTYKCEKSGNLNDECFICECNNSVIILEHCFKSDAKSCIDAKPTFLLNKEN